MASKPKIKILLLSDVIWPNGWVGKRKLEAAMKLSQDKWVFPLFGFVFLGACLDVCLHWSLHSWQLKRFMLMQLPSELYVICLVCCLWGPIQKLQFPYLWKSETYQCSAASYLSPEAFSYAIRLKWHHKEIRKQRSLVHAVSKLHAGDQSVSPMDVVPACFQRLPLRIHTARNLPVKNPRKRPEKKIGEWEKWQKKDWECAWFGKPDRRLHNDLKKPFCDCVLRLRTWSRSTIVPCLVELRNGTKIEASIRSKNVIFLGIVAFSFPMCKKHPKRCYSVCREKFKFANNCSFALCFSVCFPTCQKTMKQIWHNLMQNPRKNKKRKVKGEMKIKTRRRINNSSLKAGSVFFFLRSLSHSLLFILEESCVHGSSKTPKWHDSNL